LFLIVPIADTIPVVIMQPEYDLPELTGDGGPLHRLLLTAHLLINTPGLLTHDIVHPKLTVLRMGIRFTEATGLLTVAIDE